MSGPALLLAGFAAAGSTGEASALLAALTAASALGGPLLGVRLDRARHPGRLLARALALYAAGLLAVLASLGHLPLPAVLALAAATGLLGPALSGGWTAQLPHVAPPDRLPRANALDAMTYDVAALAGPALAGVLAAACGADAAVLLAAALIATALPAAWTLPGRPETRSDDNAARTDRDASDRDASDRDASDRDASDRDRARPGQGAPPGQDDARPHRRAARSRRSRARSGQDAATSRDDASHRDASRSDRNTGPGPDHTRPGRRPVSVRSELASGLRALTSRPALARATLSSVGACAGQGMLAACLPLLGERTLGGASRGPLLLTCTAVAALLTNAALARRPHLLAPDAAVRIGALVQAAALALAATGANGRPWVLLLAATLAGLGDGPLLTGLFAVRHREAPAHLRGQIFTTGASLKITAFALGTALAGPIATHSAPTALVLAAALTAATTLRHRPHRTRA
ncbi:MFS transporter [Kitasatospora sp. NPDC059673]|uniref:MFS transporter n=1 Tax=Kitasatospora sp. NPDC059673 TaxID=3346901 RepID=UPI0036AB378E